MLLRLIPQQQLDSLQQFKDIIPFLATVFVATQLIQIYAFLNQTLNI
jgi:hypothetical protein